MATTIDTINPDIQLLDFEKPLEPIYKKLKQLKDKAKKTDSKCNRSIRLCDRLCFVKHYAYLHHACMSVYIAVYISTDSKPKNSMSIFCSS